MKNLITYLFSNNKKAYSEIATQNGCGVLRVCALAHGKKAKRDHDYTVLQALVNRGIVSGYRMMV
ncbi:hypothetical protein M2451_001726 [Dysgonomonas sp. PFB1-18]|uniref:hypothetical protein n=1 Tax=unclassified Dysgonomonas TaxID=2630389 RepID=UPI0024748869|nr:MULTISPECIES: hypothetical protein [unclassified Dysgonomonas]MDH6309155.1 hypothetical protein [Dysgonomonas sp. PF1-14]MDH6338965.1 hypothetical protein [Dysgonomonas sp. PF1-16]MDH6380404.1 hypothetical protein [Dysgonomonas sp. PFB1-18]MDH6397793.1 hypothetical protein [Dysgonomonas sp. PF1-23]